MSTIYNTRQASTILYNKKMDANLLDIHLLIYINLRISL